MPETPRPLSIETVTQSLGINPKTEADRLLGPRVTFAMEAATLSVFPDRRAVRVETGLVDCNIAGVTAITRGEVGSIRIEAQSEQETVTLEVHASGTLLFSRRLAQEVVSPVVGLVDDNDFVSVQALRRAGAPEQGEKEKTVTVLGNVARKLPTRETATGKKIATAVIAEHHGEPGQEQTVFHKVLGFEARVALVEGLEVGQRVQVIGYPHLNTWTGRDGKQHEETQIYIVAGRHSSPHGS